MEKKERGYSAHVIVFPYPSQGHINPMLQFAKRLASKGLKITVATTHYTVKSIHALGVSVEPISDGYDQSGFWQAPSADAYIAEFKAIGSRTLTELIQKLDRLGSPVDCVVYDSLLGWVQNVTRQLGVRGAIFFTNSSFVCSIFCRLHHGLLSLPLSSDAMPLTLPGMVPLGYSELPTFLTGVVYPAYWTMVMNQFAGLDKVDWVFGNTFERLDGQAAKAISDLWPVKMIGPMVPSSYLDGRIKGDTSYGASLWKPDSDKCIQWLDTKPNGSAVYVSFGSMAEVSPKQMDEIAWGLKGCNIPFIWVVKESEQCKLPDWFEPSIEDQGLLISWCDQLQVMAHEAVGCFVTHCGWNSTLEGLCLGLPIIGVPQWADQPTNAKLVEDVCGVGLRAKMDGEGIVRREEIEFCIREVIHGERGKEIKKNSRKWRELAKEAVDEGGSSDKNIDEFVSMLCGGNRSTLINGSI
ncbi:UDP-glycosyltransferase 74B1 [Magnolia sinica]|uniref:UDP-glycosyltransferase 74B1 n=1 Tax=Magnolia sinica TaxID=86752 RepID=UPI002659FC3D|nr:UDP-glycosyltransferase 74B1 [Magnolia sinica]